MALDLDAIRARNTLVTRLGTRGGGPDAAFIDAKMSSAEDVLDLIAEVERLRAALAVVAGAPSCSSIGWAALTAFIALTGEDMPADYQTRLDRLEEVRHGA